VTPDRTGRWLYYGSLVALAVLLASPVAIAWSTTSAMLRPPWYVHPGPGRPLPDGPLRDPQRDFGLDYEEVAFPTQAGAMLRGWWIPSGDARRCSVVLAGGGWSDRRSLVALAPPLHGAGYSILAFDYRERGQSDGAGRGASYGLRESRDVAGAARFARARGAARVAVIGYSMGGTAAIFAAAQDDGTIDAVVASTPGTTLGDLLATSPYTREGPAWLRRAVARLLVWRIGAPLEGGTSAEAIGPLAVIGGVAPRPLLLLHGSDDPHNAVADAERLYAAAGEPKQLVIVGGAGHLDVLDAPQGEAQQRIVAFLDRVFCPAP
jgi:alpha-beta hydrolase superfamily lysophospholipase